VTPHRLPVVVLLSVACAVPLASPAAAHSPPATDAWLREGPLGLRPLAAATSDTLTFHPAYEVFDSTGHEPLVLAPAERLSRQSETEWLRAPVGDLLLDHPDEWSSERHHHGEDLGGVLDYNRVDLLRWGIHYQAQRPRTMDPRFGGRLEYADGRKRTLYGVQLEQPLFPTARFVFGVNLVRRTDHPELQQVDDLENSLAMLLARTDYRDYWEREGGGVYVSWRVPDFSTVSFHVREDRYRSLALDRGVRSWFHDDRALRDNPRIDDGESHSVLVRLERLARRSSSTRAGIYHWI